MRSSRTSLGWRRWAAIAALALAGCAPAGPPGGGRAPDTSAHEEGRRIYNFRCYYCHGYSGDARTLAASMVEPRPRDFRAATPDALPRTAMLHAVREGRPGTAMAAFANTLSEREIERVVDFVRDEFILNKRANTRYHSAENGWPDHERYQAAYPFALGTLALDTPWDDLSAEQVRGKRLYLSACVSCHDRARVRDEGEPWALRGVSFPEGNYDDELYPSQCLTCHERSGLAAVPIAVMAQHVRKLPDPNDPYVLHERVPALANLSAKEAAGQKLFGDNCAHCHAADGTGRNWRGSFLDPRPPDFTQAATAATLTPGRVAAAVRFGVPGTSMPAWRDVFTAAQVDAVTAYVVRAWGRDTDVRIARTNSR